MDPGFEKVDQKKACLHEDSIGLFEKQSRRKKTRYVKKRLTPALLSELDMGVTLLAALGVHYGEEFQNTFALELKRVPPEKQDEFSRVWDLIGTFEEGLGETIVGEFFRLLLGPHQPKMQFLCSEEGVDVASEYVAESQTYKHFLESNLNSADNYLQYLAAGLVYCLMVRDADRHEKQILVISDSEFREEESAEIPDKIAVFIDFGLTARGRKGYGYDLNFNANDLRYMPFVGPSCGLGGIFSPANWLSARVYDAVTQSVKMHLSDFDHNPHTYENPRFQRDIYRAVLKLLVLPQGIIAEFCRKNRKPLEEFLGKYSTVLPKLLSDRIASNLYEGYKDLIRVAAEIPEFIEYVRNVTLFDVMEIAKEFLLFSNKKRYALEGFWGDTIEKAFYLCTENLIANLMKAPFHFTPEILSFQLRIFYGNLQNKNIDPEVLKRMVIDALFYPKPENDSNFYFQFCYFDHQMRKGELGFFSKHTEEIFVELIHQADALRFTHIKDRLELVRKIFLSQKFLELVVDNFSIKLFRFFLSYQGSTREIRESEKGQRSPNLFLSLDERSLQVLMVAFFRQSSYESQCFSLNLWNFLIKLRHQKISRLTDQDREAISVYSNIRSATELANHVKVAFLGILNRHPVRDAIVLNAVHLGRKGFGLHAYAGIPCTYKNASDFHRQNPDFNLPLGTSSQLEQVEFIDELAALFESGPLLEFVDQLKTMELQEGTLNFVHTIKRKFGEFRKTSLYPMDLDYLVMGTRLERKIASLEPRLSFQHNAPQIFILPNNNVLESAKEAVQKENGFHT